MQKELTDEELYTYSRQIVLADIGYDGQLALRNARACLIGVGGLGSPIAMKLVGMGIGTLRFIDRDIVSRTDLHRQHLYDTDAIGQPKVEVAFKRLSRLNPDVTLEPVPEALNSVNAEELIGGMDIVIDGLDRIETRYIVNRTCYRLKIPYVFGAATASYGNVSTLIPDRTFCLECFMPDLKNEDIPSCGLVGVHPSAVGMVASLQVSEAIRVLIGQKPKLFNKLLYVDLKQLEFNILDIPRLESCKVCGKNPDGKPGEVADKWFEESCARDGRRTFSLSPKKRLEVNLNKVANIIEESGLQVISKGKFGISFKKKITACILKSGIMVAQTPPQLDDDITREVFDLYRSILVEGLGLPEDILPDREQPGLN
ncbi:MAG: HesA/MoeB/ThiF family protein [Desulfobacteraceae bacterium]|jgi:adenylyltransferase/sulfurtransferase|nr:HesA/MoeB/ThiF family protein [Desulfobacteraceae bacterium]